MTDPNRPTASLGGVTGGDRTGIGGGGVGVPGAGESYEGSMPRAGETIGPYKLLRPLGDGGFGVVFLAEQREPVRRRVALKLLKAGMDSVEVLTRFEAERQALAMMDHPGVAKVLDAGLTAQGRPYFAMEFVAGEPITSYCDRHRLPTRRRLELFARVCYAVQHAHQKGIIHRDLKPSNILVAEVDGEPEPKIIDFGIAKALSQPLTDRTLHTGVGRLLGTPEYMAPEQAGDPSLGAGVDVDTRADVYSLGVVLYELLTGSLPLEPKTLREAGVAAIWRALAQVDPPKPSTRLAGSTPTHAGATLIEVARARSTEPRALSRLVCGDLDWIVMKCLEKDRSRRYESASALAQDVERHLRNEPVTAGPPSAAYKVSKFVRRHKAAVAAGAGFSALVAGALVSTSVLWADAARQRDLAERAGALAEQRRVEAEAERARAEAEGARAREEAAKSRAAFEFVTQMFDTIDPANAQGREPLVREVLDAAGVRVRTALEGQPAVEAEIRSLLGQVYGRLGRVEPARDNLLRALELRRSLGKGEDEASLLLRYELAVHKANQGKMAESLAAMREVHAARAALLGRDHPDTIVALSNVGTLLKIVDEMEEAERVTREVVELQTRVVGPTHRDTLDTRCGLADLLQQLGKLDEALRVSELTSSDATAALGADDPITLQSRSIQAAILVDLGRKAEGIEMARDVLERRRRVLGAEHRDTLTTQNILGNRLADEGRMEEALPLLRDVVTRATAVLGPEHPSTLSYSNNLAQALRRARLFDEAEPVYRRTLEVQRRTQGPTHRATLTTLNNLGIMLQQAGRPAEGLPLLEECLAGLEATLPKDHWMLGASRTYVGSCLIDVGEHARAERVIGEAYSSLAEVMGARHTRTLEAAQAMVRLMEKMGRTSEAELWRSRARAEGAGP